MSARTEQLAILEAMLSSIMEKQAAKETGFAEAATLLVIKEIVQRTAEVLSQKEKAE